MRIVALLQTYNEERFIGDCLDHLTAHGLLVYLVDNESTDRTVEIAQRRLGANLIGIETLPREGHFALHPQMVRKEELALELEADWFMHLDTDEFRVTPEQGGTLAQAIERADQEGFNAINFLEFAFVPTREAPDHDHPDYARTMRSYYPILPRLPHRLNAWKNQGGRVELAASGGHVVRFPGLRMWPQSLYSRHYVLLSAAHAARKYGPARFSPEEIALGWHAWRSSSEANTVALLSERDLRTYVADHLLDPSDPVKYTEELLGSSSPRSASSPSSSAARRPHRGLRRVLRKLRPSGDRSGAAPPRGSGQSISS